MRCVVQRVSRAQVTVEGQIVGKIESGFMVLVGVENKDTESDVQYMVNKLYGMRVFEDDQEKMNLSIDEVGGSMLLVSQFTLQGDMRRGRRPSFTDAARPEQAEPLFEALVDGLKSKGVTVETGRFQTHMQVELVNDGPVTLLLDSKRSF